MVTTVDIAYLYKKQVYTKNRVSSSRFKKNKMTEITKSKDSLSELFLVMQTLEENPHCCSTGCKCQHFSYCKSYQQNTGGMQHAWKHLCIHDLHREQFFPILAATLQHICSDGSRTKLKDRNASSKIY